MSATKKSTVWLVETGEASEGGKVIAIFDRRPWDATALRLAESHHGGWVKVRPGYWESGCDWLRVTERTVREVRS
jgi:hypothetical protein